ncbi:MAG: cytochrome c [Betaproteobacteria bacterium]|nr:cytochrome c [Betaproteobacteria bacterium]
MPRRAIGMPPAQSSRAGRGLLAVTLTACFVTAQGDEPAPAFINPFLDQPEALTAGEKIYRGRCFGCHFRAGGRGPNIFRSKLDPVRFIEIVAKGGNAGMPAWGATLSGDEILHVHAFVMSRDRL